MIDESLFVPDYEADEGLLAPPVSHPPPEPISEAAFVDNLVNNAAAESQEDPDSSITPTDEGPPDEFMPGQRLEQVRPEQPFVGINRPNVVPAPAAAAKPRPAIVEVVNLQFESNRERTAKARKVNT